MRHKASFYTQLFLQIRFKSNKFARIFIFSITFKSFNQFQWLKRQNSEKTTSYKMFCRFCKYNHKDGSNETQSRFLHTIFPQICSK